VVEWVGLVTSGLQFPLSPPGREIGGMTPLDMAILGNRNELAEFLRKHGGKTKSELQAAGN
jgi:hypothetical protein